MGIMAQVNCEGEAVHKADKTCGLTTLGFSLCSALHYLQNSVCTMNTKIYAALQTWDMHMHFFIALIHRAENKLASNAWPDLKSSQLSII